MLRENEVLFLMKMDLSLIIILSFVAIFYGVKNLTESFEIIYNISCDIIDRKKEELKEEERLRLEEQDSEESDKTIQKYII